VESFDIAHEQSNELVTGGIWSICIWPEEGAWCSHVQFAPQGQACIVAFAPFGPFPTAEIAFLEGEDEFHRHYYQDYMTLLPRLSPIWPQSCRDNQDFIFNVGREVREIYRSTENEAGVYGLSVAV
jgi:hypothetical protein